jgi:hypothetical protein
MAASHDESPFAIQLMGVHEQLVSQILKKTIR